MNKIKIYIKQKFENLFGITEIKEDLIQIKNKYKEQIILTQSLNEELNKKEKEYDKAFLQLKRIEATLESGVGAIDLNFNKYDNSWAVFVIPNKNHPYIQFFNLGKATVRDIQHFTSIFEPKENIFGEMGKGPDNPFICDIRPIY